MIGQMATPGAAMSGTVKLYNNPEHKQVVTFSNFRAQKDSKWEEIDNRLLE